MILGHDIPRVVIHLDTDEFLVLDNDKIKYYDSSESYCKTHDYVSVTWHNLAFIINELDKEGTIDFDDKLLDDGYDLSYEDSDEIPEYSVNLSMPNDYNQLDDYDQPPEEEFKENNKKIKRVGKNKDMGYSIDSSDQPSKKKSKKNKKRPKK
jgi:hypothetical protein